MQTIDFPNGTERPNRLISGPQLSPEAIKAAEELLRAGNELHRKIEAFDALMPEGCYHQLYGNRDCLIVHENSKEEREED